MFFQVAEEGVPRRIGHSSGTNSPGHEWGEVTIEWCLREGDRRRHHRHRKPRNMTGGCEECDVSDSRGVR